MPLHTAWQVLVDLVYPPRCLLCHRPPLLLRDSFCESCQTALFHQISSTCQRCALTIGPHGDFEGRCPGCRNQDLRFEAAVRLGKYEEQLEQAVLKIKHAAHEGLAELLGERWGRLRREEFATARFDVIVPVPLHWRKRLWRGYNQSAALAFGLGRGLGKPCRYRWLKRIRATGEQKGQTSFEARRENVKDAFRARADVSGLHVLLVDDVMTTGATASEASRALKKAGASRVTVAVLARACG